MKLHIFKSQLKFQTLVDYACENFLFLLCGPESHQMNIVIEFYRLKKFITIFSLDWKFSYRICQAVLLRRICFIGSNKYTPAFIKCTTTAVRRRTNSTTDRSFQFSIKNQKDLFQKIPPLYDITRIRTDMYLWWSPSDTLADQSDVERYLLKQLPTQV